MRLIQLAAACVVCLAGAEDAKKPILNYTPAACADEITIDADYPGGNIVVERIAGDTVSLHQDLRDTGRWWFYWNFRVSDPAAGRTLTFRFTNRNVFGTQGPAVSVDDGLTWSWLGTKTVKGNSFSYTFPPDTESVRFAFALPYQEADLRRFLAQHKGNKHLVVHELCKTRKGRSVERIHIGKLDGQPAHRALITCRHHACESTASYVVEGMMEALLANTDDGKWLRENVEVMVVPFMDKDGVEDGDQGKGRKPRDHCRHYVGTYKAKCRGSFGWRDDHHFAWVLRALVPQYMSNPAAYQRMPRQVNYEQPQAGKWGALEPYDEDAPDIVKLIHWGADVTVTQELTHEFLKGELAYFLYAWPMLKQWLPQQNYDAVLAFVEEHWGKARADRKYPYDTSPEHNLFALKTKLGTTKGELPPGHSIMPNLLMYEVATRDGLPGADKYIDAARAQVDWIVKNLDWEDPQTTKGQRMSEHITMTSLAAFLQLCPEKAPPGLREKIQQWARVMVRRSENMWDFRKLTDDGQWTPSGEKRTMWNEPGNVVGLPAALLAAAPFVEEASVKDRLHELAWSHMDNCFGRNPCGRHFSYDAPREVEGVEHGWHSYHPSGIGQLAEVRFVLDGAPKHVHYPYHPERGNYGWTEGWVNFNTAFNVSLAYVTKADTNLELQQVGDEILVRLRAPLNFDTTEEEPVTLTVKGPNSVPVTLTETSPASGEHIGRVSLSDLGAKPGDTVTCSYGFGYLATEACPGPATFE